MSAAIASIRRDLVLGVTPFHEPDLGLVHATERGGGRGVLDLGRGDGRARAMLEEAAQRSGPAFAVRVPAGCSLRIDELPAHLTLGTVLLGPGAPWSPQETAGVARRVLAEITDLESAQAALAAGAHGLVARGNEAGGPIGELSSFVLLQHLRAHLDPVVPIWIWGGIGVRAAVAAVTAGASGVALDAQLALLEGSDTAADIAAALTVMDGSETVILAGHRLLARPGSAASELLASVRAGAAPPDSAQIAGRLGGRSLARDLVAVGQDGYLAAEFARRFGTVERAVHAVRQAVLDSVVTPAGRSDQPDAVSVLQSGSALAATLGTRLPVVQGPMTRVSDCPAFAASVAADGAMPFLALAMSDGDQSRALLAQTREAVGDRPWGAGILGFVPDDLRAAQLAAIHADPPSCVLIAGGRPSQAVALERAGIPAFLHVPSSRLLEQFLEAGARRFVFEGAECGGHVGPRASLPLWEAQISVASDFLDAHPEVAPGLSLLFAGGIHDSVSAAAVAAMAEPLIARGAGVGVLIGTAYLFTAEAVTDGAISPVFQRQVVAASRTELLTTAPGHATRCVSSPFTAEFRRTGEELHAAGVPDRQIWEALEELNVGRMRTASKGLRRDGAELVRVDADTQLAEGLFMAGQVATLRHQTTTIAELHADVSTRAASLLIQRRAELAAELGLAPDAQNSPEAGPVDVAIVGMACMFPKAPDLDSFWANILGGVDAIVPVPPERWSSDLYYNSEQTPGDDVSTPSRWGGFLPRIEFDALRYGIPPSSLPSIDPGQLLALEVARRALEDAGYGEDAAFDRGRTGVVFAAEAGGDLTNALTVRTTLPTFIGPLPQSLSSRLPQFTEDTFPGILANVIAGRIANRLDLGGPSYAVDAACASSLTAVDLACKELRQGTSDTVVCGAADLHNSIHDFVLFSSVGALSPTGGCHAFDSSADGIALGEGVAAVVLKRLDDAERDGDRIYAVIKGIGGASDGRALGLTAPRRDGQRRALESAYARAGVSPARVGLVEAHGTGTVVGDRTELGALEDVFGAAGAAAASCTLGSVKSQIGHTKCAAGLAGLIKAALAVRHGVRPPTAHLTNPNEAWRRELSPFAFQTTPAPWAELPGERVAGVSAFGFGGANYHIVLAGHEAASDPIQSHDRWPAELFTFAGADDDAIRPWLEQLLELAQQRDGRHRLRDLARTCSALATGRREPVQLALVAADVEELIQLLRHALSGDPRPVEGLVRRSDGFHAEGRAPLAADAVAMMFPGQGSQRPGMLADLFTTFPRLQHFTRLGREWSGAIHPPAAFDLHAVHEQRDRLRDTRNAQPALGVTGLAAHRLLTGLGVHAQHLGGHSYGELVALAAAGVFSPATLLDLSRARARAVLDAAGADPGAMAAVTGHPEQVQNVLAAAGVPDVVIANHNSPRQTVISGPAAPLAQAVEVISAAGLNARPIPVACAFHSPVVAAAGPQFASVLAGVDLSPAQQEVWANRTADRYLDGADDIRAELAAQIGAPVRFTDQVEAMYAAGVRVFVEAGPGAVLTGLIDAILGDRPHLAVTIDGGIGHGVTRLLRALAHLSVAGVPVRTERLFHGRDAVELASTSPRRTPGWTIDGQLVRGPDGRALTGGLQPARPAAELKPMVAQTVTSAPPAPPAMSATAQPPAPTQESVNAKGVAPVNGPLHPQPAAHNGPQHEVVTEFLRAGRELIDAQRQVVMSYLAGGAGPASAPVPASGSTPVSTPVPAGAFAVQPVELAVPQAVPAALPDLPARPAAPAATALATAPAAEAAPAAPAALAEAAPAAPAAPAGSAVPAVPAEPPAPADVIATGTADLLTAVLDVIAQRTGYPMDMLEPDLDLEADLSIDSIKRTEMVGVLAQRFAPSTDTAESPAVEMPSTVRTAAAIAQWLADLLSAASSSTTSSSTAGPVVDDARPDLSPAATDAPTVADAPAAADGPAVADAPVGGIAPRRYVERAVPIPSSPGNRSELDGARFLILACDPLASLTPAAARLSEQLTEQLTGYGATVRVAAADVDDPDADGIVVLDVDPSRTDSLLAELYPVLRTALRGDLRWLFTVSPAGDSRPPSGLRGFIRSVTREYPAVLARAVELPLQDAAAAADTIVDELVNGEQLPVTSYLDGQRQGWQLLSADLGRVAASGAGPAGVGVAEAQALGLTSESVVLLVGGARGITAQTALAIANASGCRIELAGRTQVPEGPRSAAVAAATTPAELSAALIGTGLREPAQIDRAVRAELAWREVTGTVSALERTAASVRYHAVDVRNEEAVRALVKDVYTEHGRLDGVIYGAGVIADGLIEQKDHETFTRVLSTKVDGARVLLDAVAELPSASRFVATFGSIAAVLGNRGQADYAAANDALEQLARGWSQRTGQRALTVHWGPWHPSAERGGMVSPELARHFERRGTELLDPDEATACLLRELAYGDPGTMSVVYAGSTW